MKLILIISLILIVLLPTHMVKASENEVYGVVTAVESGDTFDLAIEKADARIMNNIERIKLADVESPEIGTVEGASARDFAFAVLVNKRVYLDIDDLSGNGRDANGKLVCLVYLTGIYGQPIIVPNFNRMIVDSRHASIKNATNNEFNPSDWWPGTGGNLVEPLKNLMQDPLRQIQQNPQLGNNIDSAGKGAIDWLKNQIAT